MSERAEERSGCLLDSVALLERTVQRFDVGKERRDALRDTTAKIWLDKQFEVVPWYVVSMEECERRKYRYLGRDSEPYVEEQKHGGIAERTLSNSATPYFVCHR